MKPVMTMEVIGDSKPPQLSEAELQSIEDLFQNFTQDFPGNGPDMRGPKP